MLKKVICAMDFLNVKITASEDFDLYAEVVK
jgi:hypothetical protein